MTQYSDLIAARTTAGSIKQWVNNGGIPSETILEEAQAWIYEDLRVRQMLGTDVGTATASAVSVALPTRYRQPLLFMFTGDGTVTKSLPAKKTIDFVVGQFTYDGTGVRSTGKPNFWAADASNVVFESMADRNYPYLFLHYATPAALSTATETNFMTQTYPKLLRSACMTIASEYLKNEKDRLYWLGIAQAEIERANKDNDLELSGLDMDIEITHGGDDGFIF